MNTLLWKALFIKSPVPYLVQELFRDAKGQVQDVKILGINQAFSKASGLQAASVKNKLLTQIYRVHTEPIQQWIELCSEAVLCNKILHSEMSFGFSPTLQKVLLVPLIKDACAMILLKQEQTMFSTISSATDLTQINEDLAKANDKLKLLAITDELTGLYNRCFFEQKIDNEMNYADLHKEKFSMISFDIDHFKDINDTWGHPVGDDVLKQAAKIARAAIPNTAMLIRFGGDEFIVLMPHASMQEAAETAEQIRAAIEGEMFHGVGSITASFGVAERKAKESFKFWYKRVDEALYRAKELGRNQVAHSSENSKPIASVHIEWIEDWECGNLEIDRQHKKLLEISQGLMTMTLLTKLQSSNILQQLDRLVEHIVYHFACEEHLLEKMSYRKAHEHALVHKKLVKKVLEVKEHYSRGDIKASVFFSFLVDDVVLGHLLREDIKFFPYIQMKSKKT
ncbi:diguanylate cyclase [Propionispira raffinosivorans]|uniref:diguanylate cyclase n=1 Tax=Propionispira raffinosivorans TaxID=86959 RepID=UPI00036D72C2|nr:diguanylate cyclase [Propionispira raffinosivorans]